MRAPVSSFQWVWVVKIQKQHIPIIFSIVLYHLTFSFDQSHGIFLIIIIITIIIVITIIIKGIIVIISVTWPWPPQWSPSPPSAPPRCDPPPHLGSRHRKDSVNLWKNLLRFSYQCPPCCSYHRALPGPCRWAAPQHLGPQLQKHQNFWSGAKYHHDSTLEEWVGWTVIGVAKVDLASQVQCVQSCQSLKSSLRWYLNHNSDVTTVTITNDVPDREYNPILIWFWLTTVVSLVSFITSSTSPKPLRHHRKHKSKTTTNKNLQRCFHPGRSKFPQGQAGPHQWDGLK